MVHIKFRNRQNSSSIDSEDSGSFLGRLEGNRGLPVTGDVLFLDLGDIYYTEFVHSVKIQGVVPFLHVCYTLKSEKQKPDLCMDYFGKHGSMNSLKSYIKFYLNMSVCILRERRTLTLQILTDSQRGS